MSRPAERYKLLDRLGAGGYGVVHRTLDRATGREVAMKIMPRPRGGTNLREEFVALARLRHRNIVAVLDYGLTDGGHEYFTMELVEGPPLPEAVGPRPWRGGEESAPVRFFALIDGILDALAFVHARGMVHADVKPSNVLVDEAILTEDPGGAARLADFGLAIAIDEPAARAARGTIAYAAPEAWAGGNDARSDLYSLGIMMYELATGVRPFNGTTAREVLAAQKRGAPQDPRMLSPELPAALAELIVSLCDPAPNVRPQSADEVRERLHDAARGAVVPRSGGTATDGDPAGHRTPRTADAAGEILAPLAATTATPLVLGGPLVGRDRELTDLERAWRDARSGRGGAVLITGEEGMGTSRLIAELVLRIQLDGGTVHRASLASGDGPWTGLDAVARALLATTGDRWLAGDAPRPSHRRALAPLIAGRVAADGDATGPRPQRAADATGRVADGDVETTAARWATAEALTDLASAAAAVAPLALVLDDVHAASAPAADVIAYLARAAADAALLVILAGRRSDDDGAVVAGLAGTVKTAARGARIDMPPLDRAGIGQLAAAAIGRDLATRIGDELHRASGGNPGHALRAIAAMVEAGHIQRVHGTWVADGDLVVPMPPSVLDAARARIATVEPQTRGVLRTVAALGEAVDRTLLAAVLPPAGAGAASAPPDLAHEGRLPPGEHLDVALAEAVAARVLHADPAAGTFRLAHPELAEHLAHELGTSERRAILRRTANALEQRRATGDPVAPAQLARVYLAAAGGAAADGDSTELATLAPPALLWSQRAADAAAAAGDVRAALAFVTEALPLAHGAEAAILAERLGDLAADTGDVELAVHHYQLALGATDSGEARVRLSLAIADLHRRRGVGDSARRVLMHALAAARAERLIHAEARCHLRIGWFLMSHADYKAATEHAMAGLVIARTADDRRAAAELGRLAAAVAIYQGDVRRALRLLDDALADAAAGDDERLRAGVLHEIGRATIHAGDYARAASALEQAVAAADAAGDVEQRAKSLNNLGAAHYFLGDWAPARRAWERFRQLCERMGDQTELQFALNNLGSLYRELGMLADARSALDRAAEVAALTGNTHIAAMVLANRGEVEMRDGDLAGARERYERALGEFHRLGAREDIIETRRRLAELDLAVGRVDDALSLALDDAREARDAGVRLEEGILHRVAASGLRLQGDFESARWFLTKATEILGKLGARYELGRVALEAAAITRAAGQAAESETHLAEAESVFSQLGARGDLERVRAERRSARKVQPAFDLGTAILHELVRAVGVVDVERILEQVLDRILEVSSYERGFILLLDSDGRPREHLRRIRPGARTFDGGDAEFSGTIVRRVAASGHGVAVGDTTLDANLREQHSVISLGLRRIMCAPLRTSGRVIGIVYVDSSNVGDDRGLGLSALEALAAPLALAIENARLVAEDKRKADLMSILAHEIRNPLAGILGYSEISLDTEEGDSASNMRELMGRIRSDAERLRRLVDNVLELARHEAGNVNWSMSAIDMGVLVTEVISTFRLVCERKQIRLVVEAKEATALGNADRIAQVLSNLIGNAVKFTPSGGTITVTARREAVRAGDPNAPPIPATEIRAWVPVSADDVVGEFIRVDVADTGPGLSAELRHHMFEKFTQGAGRKRSSGIGLGLYISREIVRQHGGTIWVDSDPGRGATFSIRLPVAL